MHPDTQPNSWQSWLVVKQKKLLKKMLLLLVDHSAIFKNHLFSFVSFSGSVRRILLLYVSQLQCKRSAIDGVKKTAAYFDLTWRCVNRFDVTYNVIGDSWFFFSSYGRSFVTMTKTKQDLKGKWWSFRETLLVYMNTLTNASSICPQLSSPK